jgi:hypothetical protein
MSRSGKQAIGVNRRRVGMMTAAAGAASAAILFGLLAGSGAAGAAAAPKTTVILGNTASTPDPSCPNLPCQAIGSVTGFQLNNGQTRLPFLVRHRGVIKSWSLTLAQPTQSQRSFFNSFFGTPPEARLAILRRVPGTNPPRYGLVRQSAVKVLSPYLGQTVKFGSNLKVEKNDVVGLTVLTWAPAFSQGLASNNIWRASRLPQHCTNATDIRQGEPQQQVGRRATYGCRYTTARLLYTATLVEN